MKRPERKRHALQDLAASLTQFDQTAAGVFRCPVCLQDIPIERQQRITLAHLIPKSAGGKTTTWLCHACNSKFGHRQDKWFGEHARLLTMTKPSPFAALNKAPTFRLGETEVAGVIEDSVAGGIDMYVHTTRNSPDALANFEKEVENFRATGEASLTVEIPLLSRKAEIRIWVFDVWLPALVSVFGLFVCFASLS